MEYDYKKGLRAQVFKSLDIVQMHKASGLCEVSEKEWQDCVLWYKALCDKDWTAFYRIPKIVQKHLPAHVKLKLRVLMGVEL